MYSAYTLDELRLLAASEGVSDPEQFERAEIIEILDEIWEEKVSDRKQNNDVMRLKGKKYDIFREKLHRSYTNYEYVIPEHYPNTSIHMLLRDPYWAYAYWDINQFDLQTMLQACESPQFLLRVYLLPARGADPAEAESSFEIPITATDTSWYINLPEPGAWYQVDLIFIAEREQERLLSRSAAIESPGGYLLKNAELCRDPAILELFLAGYTDGCAYCLENVLIDQILSTIDPVRRLVHGKQQSEGCDE